MDMNLGLFLTNVAVIIVCALSLMIMPHLTRKSLLFGVRIPVEEMNSNDVKEMKSKYYRACITGSIIMIALCVIQYVFYPEITLLAVMYLPLLIIPVFLIAFIPNWKRAVELKAERKWVIPSVTYAETKSSHTRGNLTALPWAWYVISLVFVILIIILAVARYPELPDMIAAHMDENFQPTRYVDKTWLNVLTLPLVNLGTLVLMIAVGISIEKAKLQIDQNNPRMSFAQHRVYRRRMGHSLGFLTLAIILMMSLLYLPIIYPDSTLFNATFFWGAMILMSVPTIFLIIVMFKTGQGGTKVKVTITEEDEAAVDSQSTVDNTITACRGDDKFWKLGMFYYNPDDPAIVVEDRFGTNIGFNYARLPVKIILIIGVIGLVALYAWLTMEFGAGIV